MNTEPTLRGHHPGSPLYGGRVQSSSTSGSLLRKLTSLTKRSKSSPMLNSSRYNTAPNSSAPAQHPQPSSSRAPLVSSSSTPHLLSPDRMALAAAQTASLKANATTSITTNANTARPVTGVRRAATPAVVPCHAPARHTAPKTSAPLVVQVEIHFPALDDQPIYTHEYASSPDVTVTNRLFKGLLRRLHHCSTELITRKDSRALKPQRRQTQNGQPSTKPLRYEIHFRILRQDTGLWTKRTFCSYQRLELTSSDAHEIILTTHRMVGLFLRRHDPSFHWTDVPVAETAAFTPRQEEPELIRHTVGHPLPLSCVPQSRFLEESQSFEFSPGYAINLTFRSRCHGRNQYEWKRVINLQSKQNAPLNLGLAENLLWDTFQSVNSSLAERREAFFEEHKSCDFLEGVVSCQHFGEDALDIELGVQNRLGPAFDHLTRSIQSKLGLFRDPDARDCQSFFQTIHGQLVRSRDAADAQINALPDFDLRILTLCSPTWSVENPARFVLETTSATSSYSRRSIEAILDRVQTGVSDVLRNRDCTIHLVAYKRGHLVLDKALIARPLPPKPALFPMPAVFEQPDTIVTRLKERIHRDLDAVVKDTCSLDGISESAGDEDCAQAPQTSDKDALPESPSSPLLVPGAFEQTIILDDPSAVDDEEPAGPPAPRVVELPDDVFVDALEHRPSSSSSSLSPAPTSAVPVASGSKRRAFPLIPEKFTLPHSRSSSGVTFMSAKQVQAVDEVVEAPVVEAIEAEVETVVEPDRQLAVEPSVEEVVEAVVEAPLDVLVEEPIEAPEALVDAVVDNAATADLVEEVIPVVEEQQVEQVVEQTPIIEEAAVEEPHIEEPLVDKSEQVAEVEPLAEAESDSTPDEPEDRSEPHAGNDTEFAEAETEAEHSEVEVEEAVEAVVEDAVSSVASEADVDQVTTVNVPEPVEVQAQAPMLDSPPMFYTFDDPEELDDLENQPSVELRFDDNSPVVGTPLETILEYESDEDTELAFDLPSYGEFILPSPEQTASLFETAHEPHTLNLDHSLESAFESAYDSAPETVFRPGPLSEAGSDDLNEESFASSSVQSHNDHDHDESYIANTTAPTAVSSDCTRPSTPSLSLSSGDLNSPQTSVLDTPNIGHEAHAGIVSYYDTDRSVMRVDFGRGYEADYEQDAGESSASNFVQFRGVYQNDKPSGSSPSVFGQSLDVSAPRSSQHADIVFESESAPIETSHAASEDISSPAVDNNQGQLLQFDDDVEDLSPPPSPTLSYGLKFKDSYEEFAMTKPTLDHDDYNHDEYADILSDQEDNLSVSDHGEVVVREPGHLGEELFFVDSESDFQDDSEPGPTYEVGVQAEVEAEVEAESVSGTDEIVVAEDISQSKPVVEPVEEITATPISEPAVENMAEASVEPEQGTEDSSRDQVDYLHDLAASIPLPDLDDDLELDIAPEVVEETSANTTVADIEATVENPMDAEAEEAAGLDVETSREAPIIADELVEQAVEEPAKELVGRPVEELAEEPADLTVDSVVDTVVAEEPDPDSIAVEHVEFAAPSPVEDVIEPLTAPESNDIKNSQEEQPSVLAHVDEAAEESPATVTLDAVQSPEPESDAAIEPTEEPEHQSQWLQLTVPETDLAKDTAVETEIDAAQEPLSSLMPTPVGEDEPKPLIAVKDDGSFDIEPTADVSDLDPAPESDQIQNSKETIVDTPEQLEAPAPVADISTLEEPSAEETTREPFKESVAEKPIVEEPSTENHAVVEEPHTEQVVVDEPAFDELSDESERTMNVAEQQTTLDPISEIVPEAGPIVEEAQPVKEIDVTDDLPEPISPVVNTIVDSEIVEEQAPVLHVPVVDDTVELGAVSTLVPLAQAVIEDLSLPTIPTEMKSLSLDSALRSIATENVSDTPGNIVDIPTAADKDEQPTPASTDSIGTTDGIIAPPAPPAPKRMVSWSLPRAGLLGLDERRLVNVNLRSALTGSHAFDNVAFSMKQRQVQVVAPSVEEPTAEADDDVSDLPAAEPRKSLEDRRIHSETVVSESEATPSKKSKRSRATTVSTNEAPADSSSTAQDTMLPKVVMAFASMAIMSQMINKSS